MDIRKFFGPQTAAKKPTEPAKAKGKNIVQADVVQKNKGKSPRSTTGSCSPVKRKTTAAKGLELEADDAVIIEDDSDDDVVQNSFSSTPKGIKKPNASQKKAESKPFKKETQSKNTGGGSKEKKESKDKKKMIVRDSEDETVDIESIKSSGSSVLSSGNQKKQADKNNSLSKEIDKAGTKPTLKSKESEKAETKAKDTKHNRHQTSRARSKENTRNTNNEHIKETEPESETLDIEMLNSSGSSVSLSESQKKQGRKVDSKNGELDKNQNKKTTKKADSVLVSPSEKTTVTEDKGKHKKSSKRKKVSSDEEEVVIKMDQSDEDDEEEIFSSRKRSQKAKKKQSKKSSRLLDSDSEEDAAVEEKPKTKRKKKEAVTYINDSDGEKMETAMDKFVLHNVSPNMNKPANTKLSVASAAKPVSVMDFFGAGTVTRVERPTSVGKRKLDKEKEVDLTFDQEEHDDQDFLKTLDQLDGPSIKKMKLSDTVKDENQSPTKESSLASKLGNKMKSAQDASSPPVNGHSAAGKLPSPKADRQVNKQSPMKVVPKTKSVTPKSKKKPVYSLEIEPKSRVSPVKSPEEKTPSKAETAAKPEKKQSSAKKDTDNDDGFTPKSKAGYKAFVSRGGPLALGTREIPEGAANCLEGLTFVITGVLDTIERDDAKAVIEKLGGKVTTNVSGRTSYLVVGREAGESKLSKAQSLKVKQIDEEGLCELIKTLPAKVSKYEVNAKEQNKKEALEKKIQQEKSEAAAQKLNSFRSEKDVRNSTSHGKEQQLFTQIKDQSAKPSASPASLPSQSPTRAVKQPEKTESRSESLLWVDKHKPTSLKNVIGQQGDKSNARKLLHWLQSWHENILVKGLKPSGNFFGRGDGTGCRAALLSGPPGIGKTTTATLVCQEAGFSYVELNASDTRSKRSLKEVVAESLNNQTLVDYMGNNSVAPSGQKHTLIMDEVDGMAGNEDRGGLQELVQLIKTTKIPIICICNDRNSMKMRTLSNYCLDLRFQRPRIEQIKGAMMSLAFKEGLKIPPPALNEIIVASNHDIRQIIHNMSMWSAGNKNLTFEQVKKDAQKAQKDVKLGPFDVVRKVFVNDDETRKMSLNDKSDLFFHDYSFGPLFVHENYPHVIPIKAQGSHSRHLSCLARTIDSICDGDLIDKIIRKEGNWNLLPTQAMFSSVIPGEMMRGSFPQMPEFPQWLGKFSTTNKNHRILQELNTHMGLVISSNKKGLNTDYLPHFRTCLTSPLASRGSEGVPEVIKLMDDYDIIKEDFDNIMEVTKWPNTVDVMSKLDSKTKAAFTRQYNKEVHKTPYATGVVSKKRRGRAAGVDESELGLEEGEGEEASSRIESDQEEEEDIEADTMIKTKKTSSSSKGGSKQAAGTSKGKGSSQGVAGTSKGKGKGTSGAGKNKR